MAKNIESKIGRYSGRPNLKKAAVVAGLIGYLGLGAGYFCKSKPLMLVGALSLAGFTAVDVAMYRKRERAYKPNYK